MPRTHALLVGIDRYPQLAESAQLSACVHDVEQMRLVLGESFGFAAENLAVLIDREATRERILAALVALRDRAEPGDVVLFYYSGHGSLVLDPASPHIDAHSRSIVPHDARKDLDDHVAGDITDEELYGWLVETSRKTPNVVLIADTCYAAGVLRGTSWLQEKAFPEVVVPRERRLPSPFEPAPVARGLRDALTPEGRGLREDFVFLSACRRFESACVLEERGLSTFTYYLCAALRRLRPGATYLDLLEQVRVAMQGASLGQTPQLEGARHLEVFGGRFRRPDPYLPVLERNGERLVLGGGEIHGVGLGARWGVYPAGAVGARGTAPLAFLKITEVRPARAAGLLEPGASAESEVGPGCRAFELERGSSARTLGVWIEDGEVRGSTQTLKEILGGSPLLHLVAERRSCEVAIVRTPDPTGSPVGWEILGPEGEALVLPAIGLDADAAQRLRCALERIARARNLLDLAPSRDAELDLTSHLHLELGRRGPQGEVEPLPEHPDLGIPVVREGEPLAFQLWHDAPRLLYFHVLDIGQTGSLHLLYPAAGGNAPCQPRRTVRVDPSEPGKCLRLGLPKDLPAERTGGREVFKVFVTPDPEDLALWETSNLRLRAPIQGKAKSLLAEFATAYGAPVFQLRSGSGPGEGSEAWAVFSVSFWLGRSSRKEPS